MSKRGSNTGNHHGPFMQAAQAVGFWLAVLCTCLLWPQIWGLSEWLAEVFFSDHLDNTQLTLSRFPLFGIIFMAGLGMARAGLASSVAIGAIWVMSRLPIF